MGTVGAVIVTSGQGAFAEISETGATKRFRRTCTNANESHHDSKSLGRGVQILGRVGGGGACSADCAVASASPVW